MGLLKRIKRRIQELRDEKRELREIRKKIEHDAKVKALEELAPHLTEVYKRRELDKLAIDRWQRIGENVRGGLRSDSDMVKNAATPPQQRQTFGSWASERTKRMLGK